MANQTPLFEEHKKLGAKMIDFGGWLMPVSYESVLAEHKNVREHVGIFDVSHMGEIRVTGPDAENFMQYLTINDINKLRIGHSHYSAILNESGGFIDDIIIYRLDELDFFICVNASNSDKDFAWIKQVASDFKVKVTNESKNYSQIAVQGPKSRRAMELVFTEDVETIKSMKFGNIISVTFNRQKCMVGRTGYTGEHGYEIYLPNSLAVPCWNALLQTKGETGISPIGLGARDTLRLEASYLLYGNDMNETVTPFEAGVSWAVRMDCGEFIGKGALDEQNIQGLSRLLMCFVMTEPAIPRHDMDIFLGDELVGKVTSGSVLPTVGGSGGMALIDPEKVKVGDEVRVDVRGKRRLARIVKRPLYTAKTKT